MSLGKTFANGGVTWVPREGVVGGNCLHRCPPRGSGADYWAASSNALLDYASPLLRTITLGTTVFGKGLVCTLPRQRRLQPDRADYWARSQLGFFE